MLCSRWKTNKITRAPGGDIEQVCCSPGNIEQVRWITHLEGQQKRLGVMSGGGGCEQTRRASSRRTENQPSVGTPDVIMLLSDIRS